MLYRRDIDVAARRDPVPGASPGYPLLLGFGVEHNFANRVL